MHQHLLMPSKQYVSRLFSAKIIIPIIIACLASCSSLKPVTQNSSLQSLQSGDIAKLDGDYEIISTDTSYPTLARALTFTNKKALSNFNQLDKLHEKNVRLHIQSLDDRHLKVTIYSRDKAIKSKKIKGKLSDNYFHFKMTKISPIPPFYFLLSLYKKQDNRIGVTESGDLVLDSYEGGVLLLIALPTFGGDTDSYNLIFKRKKSNS